VIALASGFATALREELDFRVEARNLAAVSSAAPATENAEDAGTADGARVVIPAAYHDLSTRRVLVMERLDGVPVSKAGPALAGGGIDRERLARALFDSLLRQIMVDGIFHADPHPGNILLLDDGRLSGHCSCATWPPGSRPTRRCSPTCSASWPGTSWPSRPSSRPPSGPCPPWRGR
jgi:ubiquinone biosynthesis protein